MDSVEAQTALRARYLRRPYHVVLISDGADGWTAQVEELPGCEAHAATADEAARQIREAMEDWIAEAIAQRRTIPRPRRDPARGGRLTLGLPESLRDALSQAGQSARASAWTCSPPSRSPRRWAGVRARTSRAAPGSTIAPRPSRRTARMRSSWVPLAIRANVALIALAVFAAVSVHSGHARTRPLGAGPTGLVTDGPVAP